MLTLQKIEDAQICEREGKTLELSLVIASAGFVSMHASELESK